MASHIKKSVQLSALCIAIACVHTQALALENLELLDDEMLAESTGEGIGFLPENFSVRMNGIDNINNGEGTYGAGYIRIIPVGPLSTAATAKNYQKADMWLYGVSLAQSKDDFAATIDKDDWGVPFGAITAATSPAKADFGRPINSWGTAENPWIFKTLTDTTVPNFAGVANNSVTYMALEAPRFDTTLPESGTVASSAYNLKFGMWADLFMRDPETVENAYDGLSNRLRLGFVWDGFSINGSNFNVFQTLDGVTSAMGGHYTAALKRDNPNFNPALAEHATNNPRYIYPEYTFKYGMDTSYNKTLGLSGLFRFNSRPTDTIRATTSFGNTVRTIHRLDYAPATNWNSVTETYAGSYSESAALATNTVLGRVVGTMSNAWSTIPTSVSQDATSMSSAGLTMTYDPMVNGGYRGSPALPNNASAATAALGGYKPSYYYRNGSGAVVRGEFYDGGICSSSKSGTSSGNNQFGQCLNREGFITRRLKASTTNSWTPPDAKSVLRLSTQELSGGTFGTGTPALGGGSGMDNIPNFAPNTQAEGIFAYDTNINLVLGSLYQPLMLSTDGNNFSVELARIPNQQNVYKNIYQRYANTTGLNDGSGTGDGGISYLGNTCNIHQCGTSSGGYQGYNATHSSISIGSTVYNAATNQLTAYKGLEAYGISVGELKAGTGFTSATYEDYVQVYRATRTNWNAFPAWQKAPIEPDILQCGSPGATAICATHPSLVRINPYETRYRQNYNNQVLGIQSTMPQNEAAMANKINNLMPVGKTVSNNFGSVAIDGLLIQHFKFSTTGL